MTKKKGLFCILRRLFVSEATPEKKDKRRKWAFWKLNFKKRLPSITATEGEERNKHGATAEYEVVQSTDSPQSDRREQTEEDGSAKIGNAVLDAQFEDQIVEMNRIEDIAVVKIQTAFRGYLAKKALRALKGIVKLQAYIRGRAVRRQAMTTLKCLQSVVNIQSQVCARRNQIPGGGFVNSDGNNDLQTLGDKIIKVDTNSQKRWDASLLTREEAEAVVMSKKEATIKRERIREYVLSHRKSAESYQRRPKTRWKYWLDQWVDTQLSKSKELEDLDFNPNPKPKDEIFRDRQLRTPKNTSPRRMVHHKRQLSVGDNLQNPGFNLPTVALPTYMAATESAKAKARSLSSPRERPESFDTQSESYSPYKSKLYLRTSIMSEAPSRVRVQNSHRPSAYYRQRSPSLNGHNTAPVKSNKATLKDLSIDSECSLPSWNRQSSFR